MLPGLSGSRQQPPAPTHGSRLLTIVKICSLGGKDDWRLPTIKELSTLVDSSIPYPGPTINTSYFPDTVASDYWSSTTFATILDYAWNVDFYYGDVDYDSKSYSYLCSRRARWTVK